jgi:hypothetical protein
MKKKASQFKQHSCSKNGNRIRIYHEGEKIDTMLVADNWTENWLIIRAEDLREALKKVGYELTLIPK